MSVKKTSARRRAAAVLAACGMLVMSSGVALMVTASPAGADPISQPNPNHEDHWETLPGEVCEKTDVGAESGNVVLPAEPADRDYSKLIIKKGSGNIGVENQVFNNPVAGQPGYEWVGFQPQQSGGWSHYIVCTVPEPDDEPTLIAVDIVFTDPSCANENVASYEVTGDTANVTVESNTPAAPGASVTVTATANDGYIFAGDETEYSESHEFDEAESPCDIVLPPEEVVPAAPTFGDPDCETAPSYALPDPAPVTTSPLPDIKRSAALIETKDVDGVQYVVEGDLVPGGTITVTATALEGYVIAEGAQTVWEHTFAEVEDCEVPPAPPVDTETPGTTVATPTVVSAGLTDAADLRGAQGMALLVTGMIMMVFAGGLGLRKSQA
jgi:hypothetical protein